jgi:hypothetical protein
MYVWNSLGVLSGPLTMDVVPSGVLSVLPGYGYDTGKEIISNPLIRKVDVTVSIDALILDDTSLMFDID